MDLLYFSSGPRERVLRALLDSGHSVSTVFATDPERWPRVIPTVELAHEAAIPVRIVGRDELAGLEQQVADRVCLSAGFAYILPGRVLRAAKLCMNVHGTLLPKYAGARTLNWVIENGETESGVTVHLMAETVDAGPIVVQRSFPLTPFDTGASLYRKTLAFEAHVVLEALALVESGQAAPQRQDNTGVRRWPDRVPEHSRLDPERPLAELYNKIRAADPERYPAYFLVDGQKVCVRLWRPEKPDEEQDMV